MANRECNGDFFEVIGKRYYRCLWDGAIIARPPKNGAKCKNCKRIIDAVDHGQVRAQYRTVLEAVLPSGARFDIENTVKDA